MATTFNTPAGQTIARELMIAYLNTGTDSSPVWSPFGRRTTDSSIEYDWSEETSQDILGHTWTTMKKPVMTQTFDPWNLDGGDAAQQLIYQKAIVEQDAQALTNMDVMIAHFYSGSTNAAFAERYRSCMVKPSSLGGEGGGNLDMPVDVTYGGERTVGTVSKGTGGAVTFSAGSATVSTYSSGNTAGGSD